MVFGKRILLPALFIIASFSSYSQTDTAFWFAAPTVTSGHENTPEVFRLSSYATAADVTVSEPANSSFQSYTVHLAPYSSTAVTVTSQLNQVENKPGDKILNYGIKISATANISAYYEVGISRNPEIFPLKGVLATGLKFLIPSQTTLNNTADYPMAKSGFIVVATQNNTTVTINLTKADSTHSAGSFTVTLNKGQTYAVRAAGKSIAQHLGGSTIVADKPVSVTIYDDSIDAGTICISCTCKDLIGDQILPENSNGSEFIIVRGALDIGSTGDYYYVWSTVDGTTVSVNGTIVATLNRGDHYTGFLTASSAYVVTSNPVYLYQMTGVSCEVASTNLPSITCTGSSLVSFVRSTSETFQLNLLCRATDVDSFYVNGVKGIITSSLFETVPNTNGVWKAARITSSNLSTINSNFIAGSTSVVSNTSGLFHLGFMNGANTTGARLGYFSNYSSVQSSPVVASSTTCYGSNIQLSSTFVSGATYQWTGPDNFSSSIYNPVIEHATLANSGTYHLTATITGCATSTDSVVVTVHSLPVITFSKEKDTICYGNSTNINFSLSGTAPWTVVYSDGTNTDTLTSITSSPAYFTVSPKIATVYSIKTIVDSNSCAMDTTTVLGNFDTLLVSALPVANFGYSSPLCEKNAILFSDSSKAGLDTLTNWYWNMGNGDIKNLTTATAFTETYAAWGADTVKLAVQSSLGCKSDTISKAIIIHPLPKPGFILPDVCLNDSYAQFADTTSIADNLNSFSYLWNFGDVNATVANPDTSIVQNAKHKYSAAGIYKVSVKVTSGNGCTDSLTQSFTVNGAIPVAGYSLLNSLLCSNDSVRIKDNSTVDFGSVTKIKIYWDYASDPTIFDSIVSPVSGKTYAHLYKNFQQPSTRSCQVHFQAYSGITCVNSKDTVITLHASPQVQFNILPGICYNAGARQITQAIETGGVTGSFTYSGSGVSESGLFTPAIVGTDSIQALYISDAGCRDSAKQAITVWPLPTAKWTYSYPDCEKNNITFTDNSIANFGKILTRNWSFGDNTDTTCYNATAFVKKYAAYGSYTATLLVATDSGCTSLSSSQIITINPLPVVNFTLPTAVCLPGGNAQFYDKTTIADNTTTLFSYLWNFGDNNNTTASTLKNPVHPYSALGSYTVKLIVTSGNNCIDSISKTFDGIYPQSTAAFTIDSTEICMGHSIHFYDASTHYTGSILSWNWDLAEGYTATTQNTSRQFADSGTYQISLYITDSVGCLSNTAVKNVVIDPYPHLTLAHNMLVLQGGSATITPNFYATNPVFLWTPSLYLDSTNVAYPVTTPQADITYKLTLTSQGNCTVSDTVLVKVLLAPVIPNIFSPNGDGINDTWAIQYLDSYPDCIVEIFDRGGQIVFKSTGYPANWNGTRNGKPLPVGTYYYIINPKNGRSTLSGSVTIIR